MIQTGFESRVKIQDIISSQLPEFILDESPKTLDFLKQYYISQEYQGGTVDIVENLDQYLKLDNLTPEIIVDSSVLESPITDSDDIITVSSTKGFPPKYGLLKIDDEIITYTGITTNTFTGCIRGFSGITNYHDDLNSEELIFQTSNKESHNVDSKITNLSSLFLKEFFEKFKSTFAPGFESRKFNSKIDVGNFIKEIKSLYSSKGTDESFRILFNVLFGINPTIVNLEDYLLKSSGANYVISDIVILESISEGNPVNLKGQTLFKNNDTSVFAAISSIVPFTRGNRLYYKANLFVGSDDGLTAKETFDITPNTKCLEDVNIGDSVISVDSTIGFPESGTIHSGSNKINYTNKSVNQFFGCSGINEKILSTSNIYSDETYFSFEDGDSTKRVDLRVVGVISNFKQISPNITVSENQKIGVKDIGDNILNPQQNKTYKEIFANSWIYNTSSSIDIESISGSTVILKNSVDKSQLKKNDTVEIVDKFTNIVVYPTSTSDIPFVSQKISSGSKQIFLSGNTFSEEGIYKLRRKINKSSSSTIEFLNGNGKEISDIQNLYTEEDKFAYVASNSLPSTSTSGISTEFLYNLDIELTQHSISSNSGFLKDRDLDTDAFTTISFEDPISFITGDRVAYEFSDKRLFNLENDEYYIKVINSNSIKLFESKSTIDDDNFAVKFYSDKYPESNVSSVNGSHNFVLFSQSNKFLSGSKILKKFPIPANIQNGKQIETVSGSSVGMLINGVEISNYKSSDKVYYGPLDEIRVLNGGRNYDVINLPLIKIAGGSTEDALAIPVVTGTITDISVKPQEFDIEQIASITIDGGNSKGGKLEPVLIKRRREVLFDGRRSTNGGGIDVSTNQLSFVEDHNFFSGQEVVYLNNGNENISIGLGSSSLVNNESYFVSVDNSNTVQIHKTFEDAVNDTNPIVFGGSSFSGTHKFKTADFKNTLSEVRVIDGGSFTNRQLFVKTSGISTAKNTINFENHGFSTGEIVEYFVDQGESTITGLSTTKRYYVVSNDKDSFQLCDAGVGNTIFSNFEDRRIVELSSTGTGYQKFKYPDIKVTVNLSPVGSTIASVKSVEVSPTIKGSIEQVYLYHKGLGYGSKTINFERVPKISVKNGRDGSLKPNITSGFLISVNIEFSGLEYFSEPDLELFDPTGKGSGAKLKANISNGKIISVTVINKGSNYSPSSKIIIRPRGLDALFEAKIRSLTVDETKKRNEYYELKNKDSGLQFLVNGYLDNLQNSFGELKTSNSNIIGWAYDGNPIYGPFGISDPDDINSTTKTLLPGYVLDSSKVLDRPSGFSDGFFVEDYHYDNSGDLDEHNGRFAKTKEFPNGVYAYHATIDDFTQKPKFPYFIGNFYRSSTLDENKNLSQNFNFDQSNLKRNTFPYKITEDFSQNDFIVETGDVVDQEIKVDSISKGFVDKIEVVNPGQNYKVGDKLIFENEVFGGGLQSEVASIEGKEISNIVTSSESFNSCVFVWGSNTIKVHTPLPNTFENGDFVNITGFTTSILTQLNGSYRISVNNISNVAITTEIVTSGVSTDIYVTNIPNNVSLGSSIVIGSETLKILNLYPSKNIIRVERGNVGTTHTTGSEVEFKNYTFSIEKTIPYFESTKNTKVYFNPTESVGIGTIRGKFSNILFGIGEELITISVPTQSIFIKNHPFKDNQKLNFVTSGNNNIQVKSSPDSVNFNLPSEVYVVNKSKDTIGLKTSLTTDEVYFSTNGEDSSTYFFETTFEESTAKVQKNKATVSVSTDHNLSGGDIINLSVSPSLSVGIGTSTKVNVLYNNQIENLVVNPININTSDVDVNSNEIQILDHHFKTGDKVIYENPSYVSPSIPVHNRSYFVYVKDSDTIKLCDSLVNAQKNPPEEIGITSIGNSSQTISSINPQIEVVKNNNLVFDLSDSSLTNFDFKVFYDRDFLNDFVSIGSTNLFVTQKTGTIGSPGALFTVNYNSSVPQKIYYSLEKSGFISTSDTTVRNYSEILYVDSLYGGSYSVFGIGSTTSTSFDINLKELPERSSYTNSECDVLKYNTTSKTATGGVQKIKIKSKGSNYTKLPSLSSTNSENGEGLSVLPKSESIGNITKTKIISEKFEYSSDKTLKPNALISPIVSVINSNIVGIVSVISGGVNFVNKPDLVLINKDNKKEISNGVLVPNLVGSSISSIDVEIPPKGISDSGAEIYAVNNTNGVSIKKVKYDSNTQTFDCVLTTPFGGFSKQPFEVNDEIFLEGIQKEGSGGDGFNSRDYGYKFFTITAYGLASDPSGSDVVTVKSLSTNPGIAKTIQDSSGTMINRKNYPIFDVIITKSNFEENESLLINDSESDYTILEYENSNNIKIFGTDKIQIGDTIRGFVTNNVATVKAIETFKGEYTVSASNRSDDGWSNRTGFLNEDYQVLSDNDYYQNLSYAIKSPITWDNLKTPVNDIIHTSGTKNFAHTEIIVDSDDSVGIKSSKNVTTIVLDIINENRVDVVNDFDLVQDVDVFNDRSRFLKLKSKKLSDFTEAVSNVVLKIDDISEDFSDSEFDPDLFVSVEDEKVNDGSSYQNFLFKVVSEQSKNQIQLTDMTVLSNPGSGDFAIIEKETLVNSDLQTSHSDDQQYGDFSLETDLFGDTFIRFTPKDPFNTDYNIKLSKKSFNNQNGISTESVGFVDLISFKNTVNSGNTQNIIGFSTTLISSILVTANVIDGSNNNSNLVELYVTHDGENPSVSEYFVDTENEFLSNNFIGVGSFIANIQSGQFTLDFENQSSSNLIIESRIVGFGSTSRGEGIFRFLADGQPDTTERTLIYKSDFTASNAGAATTVISLNKFNFDSLKSIIEVGIGSEKSLHQVLLIQDQNNIFVQQSPYLTEDEYPAGIGTFGGQYLGSTNFNLMFYPDSNQDVNIVAFSQCFYTEVDFINQAESLTYGSAVDQHKVAAYNSINGDRFNATSFTLTKGGSPIFARSINPANTNQLNASTGTITSPGHFFNENEELIYTAKSSFAGVAATEMTYKDGSSVGLLPSSVFVVNSKDNTFQISTSKAGSAVTFTDIGSGNAHQFEMSKSNEKTLITLSDLVQYPLAPINVSKTLSGNGGLVSAATSFLSLSGISSINPSDILKVDDEYMLVTNVGLGTTNVGPISGLGNINLVDVKRGSVGTSNTTHTDGSNVEVFQGTFNITDGKINFTNPPRGNAILTRNESNLEYESAEFSGRVYLRADYSTNKIFDNIGPTFTGIGRTYTLTVGGGNTIGIGTSGGNGFVVVNGIYQSPISDNNPIGNYEILEDSVSGISSISFTGIRSDLGDPDSVFISEIDVNQNQVPRGGLIVSIGSSGGLGIAPLDGAIVFPRISGGGIDEIVGVSTYGSSLGIQTASYDEETGILQVTTPVDHNLNSYNQQIWLEDLEFSCDNAHAGITTTIFPDGTLGNVFNIIGIVSERTFNLDIGISTIPHSYVGSGRAYPYFNGLSFGSGYREPVSVTVTEVGHNGQPASIQANVGAGGTLSFNIINPGSGYVNPQIMVSEPSYSDLSVIGISRIGIGATTDTGVGLKLSVDVGASSTTGIGSTFFEVKNFQIKNNGYGFRKGDKFKPVGLVTDSRLSSPITDFELTVLETYNDNFAIFQYGEFDYIDSVQIYQDGFRRRFPLFYQGDLISFESGTDDISDSELQNLLLIIINGIIQDPGTAYTFEGGTTFLFSQAPKKEDKIDIFFYRGTKGVDDRLVTNIIPSLEVGDTVQVYKNNNISGTKTQDERVIFDLSRSDVFETNPYVDQGINEFVFKPMSWIKQKTDRVVNGEQVFKTRESILSQVYPVAKIIKNVSTSDNFIFVDNIEFFSSDDADPSSSEFKSLIVDDNNFVSADVTTTVGFGGTISAIAITNPGSGYVPSSTVDIRFANPINVETGVGTTASATGTISIGGTLQSVTITNPGFGYTVAPRAIVETISPSLENTGIIQSIKGFNGDIVGIGTTTSSGQLALKFDIRRDDNQNITDLTSGYAILIHKTNVGSGVTTVNSSNGSIIGISTNFLDNIYYIDEISTSGPTGVITCVVDSGTNTVGIATTGGYLGRFSWGRLENITRGSSPVSIGVSGRTVDDQLSKFPSVIRRGVGLRQTGAII